MTDLAPGDILIGGLGHIDIIHPNGTLERRPIVDALGKPLQVNGIAVSPSGHYQFAASPPGETINRPHDIAYLPDGSGYIEIGQASPRSAQLWKFDLAGNRVGTWTIETDDGWTTGLLRLDVAPDGKTVYYTDSGRTIFRFDISTDDGMQLQPFDKLPMDSPNIYAGFKLLSDGGIVLAMSKTGNGPRDAVCLDNDRTSFWTDEVNPAVPGQYHIYRRSLADSGNKIDTYPNPDEGYLEYEVMCLACYLRGDARYGVHSKALSNAGPPVASSWFADVRNLGVGRVRTEIRYTLFPQAADCDASDTTIDQALDPIGVALAAYKRAAVEPLAILASGILGVDLSTDFRPGGTGLCPATGKNYFQAFSDRAATIASKLHTLAGVTCFEIWNEPNVPLTPDGDENDQYIANSDDFAQLVFGAANAIVAALAPVEVTIVTGGVFFSDHQDDFPYLTDTMTTLKSLGPASWQQIGVHAYWSDAAYAGGRLDDLSNALEAGEIEPRTLWITEFGVQRACQDPACPVDERSGLEQASDLATWYSEAINPRLSSGGGAVDAAFWFSHENELQSAGATVWNTWGLTNWDTNGDTLEAEISPSQHWPSWEQLRESMAPPAP
ncbi:MAG TPA: glycosyl hydrolase [Chloroflexota bacterium]|nr:glycosyl hydrolase [Chloroflexota bacterium]